MRRACTSIQCLSKCSRIQSRSETFHSEQLAEVVVGIAAGAFVLGICGAFFRGFWGVSHDCQSWVDSHGYQLVQNDWWAKDRCCVARTPTGEEIVHSADLGSK